MSLTPETLTRHELNGLPVRVADADSDDYVGIGGRVVLETMRTLLVDCGATESPRDGGGDSEGRRPSGSRPEADDADGADDDGARVRQVPKRGTTFEFRLPNDDTDAGTAPASTRTDEAAGAGEAPGSTSQLGSETAGVRPGQSGPSAAPRARESGASQRGGETRASEASARQTASKRTASNEGSKIPRGAGEAGDDASREQGECKDVGYVTVDGAQLLSRPATRTERAGDSKWH